MAHLVRQRITYYVDASERRVPKDTPGARKVKGKSAKWYGQGIPGLHPKKRIPLTTDKRAAEAMLADMVIQAERRLAKLDSSELEHARRPLLDHLTAFELDMMAKGNTVKQVQLKVGRVRRIVQGCEFTWIGELSASKVQQYLADLRDARREVPELAAGVAWYTKRELADALQVEPHTITATVRRHGLAAEGQGRKRRYPRATAEALRQHLSKGMGPQTFNHYVEAVKSFCNWLVDDGRLAKSPLDSLGRQTVATDVRRGRRALVQAELQRLFETTKASGETFRDLAGVDRWILYLTACGTGFREGELAALLPEWFAVDAMPPTVTLPAREGKNRKPTVQPLPQDLAGELRTYLAGKPARQPVWPGRWQERGAEMLRQDLAAAGIPYVVESPDGPLYADFHSLRHSFVAMLDQTGASLKQAMQLARHSDPKLTMARYGRAQAQELAQALDRLPLLSGVAAGHGLLAGLPRDQLEALAVAGVVALAFADSMLAAKTEPAADGADPGRPRRSKQSRK